MMRPVRKTVALAAWFAFGAIIGTLCLAAQAQRDTSKPTGAGPSNTRRLNTKGGLNYIQIPAGEFVMGCSPDDGECLDAEKPVHRVKITKPFWIGQTEVTVGAYKQFSKETGKPMPEEPNYYGRPLNKGLRDDAMPIVGITWREAQAYCTWAGGRLPTEAEWEFAARAGNGQARYGNLDEVGWYADNSGQERIESLPLWKADPTRAYGQRLKDNGNGMHDVAQKKANAFGLFDTLGNVWEWTNDWYDPAYYKSSPVQDPTGPENGQYKVLRGGSWDNIAKLVRVSVRGRLGPSSKSNGLGFRCVWEPGRR